MQLDCSLKEYFLESLIDKTILRGLSRLISLIASIDGVFFPDYLVLAFPSTVAIIYLCLIN